MRGRFWLVFGSQDLFKIYILPDIHHGRFLEGFLAVHHWRTTRYILPCTVWSGTFFQLPCSYNVINVLLRTHWKPAAKRFRQKSSNKLVYLAENPRPTVFGSFLLFHHWRTTRYSLPGRGKFNYLWTISLGHPVFLRRIFYFDRPCKGARYEWLSSLHVVTIDGAAVARHTFWHLILRFCLKRTTNSAKNCYKIIPDLT